jgi:hypothetical protein
MVKIQVEKGEVIFVTFPFIARPTRWFSGSIMQQWSADTSTAFLFPETVSTGLVNGDRQHTWIEWLDEIFFIFH